jgi:iron complex outermembrane receptor protein
MAYHEGYTYGPYARTGFDNEDSQSWRASVHWQPFDGITNDFVINGYSADEKPTAFRLTDVLPGSLFATRTPETLAFLASVGDRRLAGNEDPLARTVTRALGVSNITAIEVSDVTVKNIFGYRRVRNSNALDFDGTPFTIYVAPESLSARQYSDELQILGKGFDKRLNWIGGVYWFRETGDETQSSLITAIPQSITRTGTVRNVSKSLFAQASYEIGSARDVTLTGGGRYTWDNRRFQQFAGYNLLTGTCLSTLAALPNCDSDRFSKNFGAFTYTISADWRFAANNMVYVAHRKGYRSGGFNLRATTAAQFRPFDPESVKDLEGGLKADWDIGGTRLRTNIAVYYQWYSDIQRNVAFVDPGSGTLAVSVVNAAKAYVFGFEAEARWFPVPNLEVGGNVSHSRLRYDSFVQALPAGGTQDLSDNRLSFAPEWQGGASMRYTLPLQAREEIAVQGDLYAQARMELADLNVPRGRAAGYTMANFRIEWNHVAGSPISAAAFVRNAFDKDYFTGGLAITGLGPIAKQYGAPRTYGFELRYVFGE